jgi:hypothetical protein
MRHLLDALRREDEQVQLAPQPWPGQDPPAASGRTGRRPRRTLGRRRRSRRSGAGLDLSAYRIIQEGLTNALKHADAEHAWVKVAYGADHLELAIRDDGRGPTASPGLGHGLVGIGERVKIFGGDMTAGRVDGGGFLLRARLPLRTG